MPNLLLVGVVLALSMTSRVGHAQDLRKILSEVGPPRNVISVNRAASPPIPARYSVGVQSWKTESHAYSSIFQEPTERGSNGGLILLGVIAGAWVGWQSSQCGTCTSFPIRGMLIGAIVGGVIMSLIHI
jgi:hypothetical protein